MDSKLRDDLIKIIGDCEFEKKYENFKNIVKQNDNLSNDLYQDYLDYFCAGSIYEEYGYDEKAEENFIKAETCKSAFHEDFINQKGNFFSNVFLQKDTRKG